MRRRKAAAADWRTPPPTSHSPGGPAASAVPLPYLVHPDILWEELTPQARAAMDALNRDTIADINGRLEAMRLEHPLRE